MDFTPIDINIPSEKETLQLPDPWLTNYWELENNRIFYLDSEIDESVLDIQRSIILINIRDKGKPVEERVPIKIYIDSPGGNVDETMSLCTTIIKSTTPVITVNVAQAYSAAGLIFMAGHKRFAFPYSKALIHSGSGCIGGTFEQTEQAQRNYKKQVDEMMDYILERSSISSTLLKKNKSKDWYFDAEEQITYGIATKIIESLEEII